MSYNQRLRATDFRAPRSFWFVGLVGFLIWASLIIGVVIVVAHFLKKFW